MRAGTIIGTVVWAVAVLAGGAVLNKHQFDQGATAVNEPQSLPARGKKSTLMVFLHPQCPCSHATVAELDRIMSVTKGAARAELFFYHPDSRPFSWCHTALWQQAAMIPGTVLHEDQDGRNAAHFDAHTSGQVLLYSPKGKLEFSGGITDGRGHEGDNDGEISVIDFLRKGHGARTSTPVFGCVIR